MSRKKLLFVYTLNQTFHWFIMGLLIPVMALLRLEKGLDLFQRSKMPKERRKRAAPCGLYCGTCSDLLLDEVCHGCGCDCGQCAAGPHHTACTVYRCCVIEKELETCAECEDFPCTRLIQFAYDPIWRTHLPVLENLRRIQHIGLEAWLDEQEAYWADQRRLDRWLLLHRECQAKYQQTYGE